MPSNIMMLAALVRFPLVFISGIFVPLAEMTGTASTITMFSPLTYLVDGFDHALGNGGAIPLVMDLLMLMAFTAAFLLAANYMLKRKSLMGL